jgi:hypothetical protein
MQSLESDAWISLNVIIGRVKTIVLPIWTATLTSKSYSQ